jgi:hypothetical protein
MAVVQRTDVGAASRLGKFARNGAGAVRVPATIARTGTQKYVQADGSVLVEYRPADEVFAEDSLATLGSVPVTLRHPDRGVSPENATAVQVGHVSDAPPEARVRVDGSTDEWLRAQLVVADGTVQNAIEGGKAGGISCGYSCELDFTPGITPDGTKYDAIQRKIRFNHVAILTSDQQPRAGGEAKLRLDSQGNPMKKIVIDGVELEYGSAEHFAHVAAAHQKALNAEKARADKAEAERDALQAKVDAEKTRADAAEQATSQDRIDAAVEARMALFARAARLLPADYETKGKSDAQVRADAVTAKLGAEKVAGKSAAYLDAMFDILADGAAPTAPAQYHAPKRADVAPGANINDSDEAFRASLASKLSAKEDE